MTQFNWTTIPAATEFEYSSTNPEADAAMKRQSELEMMEEAAYNDGIAAGYYVIVVILVYGMSIVLLIASSINRKHRKLLEDRQIHNYLKEFQVVQERSSRDHYRNLKKTIVAKLGRGGGNVVSDRASNRSGSTTGIYRCLSKTVIPLTALGLPTVVTSSSGAVAVHPEPSKKLLHPPNGHHRQHLQKRSPGNSQTDSAFIVPEPRTHSPDGQSQPTTESWINFRPTLDAKEPGDIAVLSRQNVTVEINNSSMIPRYVTACPHGRGQTRPCSSDDSKTLMTNNSAGNKPKSKPVIGQTDSEDRYHNRLITMNGTAPRGFPRNVNTPPQDNFNKQNMCYTEIPTPSVARKSFPIGRILTDEHLVQISSV